MSKPINLADPEFEPTDEQLTELSTRAFAHVSAARDRTRAQLRVAVGKARAEALKRLKDQLNERLRKRESST